MTYEITTPDGHVFIKDEKDINYISSLRKKGYQCKVLIIHKSDNQCLSCEG